MLGVRRLRPYPAVRPGAHRTGLDSRRMAWDRRRRGAEHDCGNERAVQLTPGGAAGRYRSGNRRLLLRSQSIG